MNKIEIKNLCHKYYLKNRTFLPVLEGIELSIQKEEFCVILGDSGCGKTTLLNIIAGLIEPVRGSVFIDGKKITAPHYSRSFIFQSPQLLPWLNIFENIAFGCNLRKDTDNLETRVEEYIELIGLKGFENNYPDELSQGMAQRAAIARSLIGKPDILLLDEPFRSLDYFNRSIIISEFTKLWEKFSFTTIFVTHDLEIALTIGRKIILLSNRPAKVVEIIKMDHSYQGILDEKKKYRARQAIQKKMKAIHSNTNRNL